MGRLEIQVRHGHSGGPAQWGGVVALIVLVAFAAAGHREIGAMEHEILSAVEIAAFSAVGLAALVVTLIITVRVRRAARDRRRVQRLEERAAQAWALRHEAANPALDQARPDVSWPSWAEVPDPDRRAS